MRVLVAEDELQLAAAIQRGLEREGMAVDVANDGERALMNARVYAYDVVVLDRDLPEMHGDDVCRALAGDVHDTKILMLTVVGALARARERRRLPLGTLPWSVSSCGGHS